MKNKNLSRLADFLYEIGTLARTPRSGFSFLLAGKQNVAEHSNRVVFVALTLASKFKDVNLENILLMALFHDSTETRISDLNYVHQKYVTRDEDKAQADQLKDLPFGGKISDLLNDYRRQESQEAQIVKDADNLELLLTLKENEQGNPQIAIWCTAVLKRLKTDEGRQLADAIISTNPWDWWKKESGDDWWIHRQKN